MPGNDGMDVFDPSQPPPGSAARQQRPRTNTATIDSTIIHPGTVAINVQGAFIVDEEPPLSDGVASANAYHETKDIRLPNQSAVVSHVAIDVSFHSG